MPNTREHNQPLTIVADMNIASLEAFFNETTLSQEGNHSKVVNIITTAGRDITADFLAKTQPQILLIRSVTPVNEDLLKDNNSVRFVGSATIGTDHVDQHYLAKRNITFANAAGSSKHSVAQYVITAILTLQPEYWQKPLTLGIIGLGNIGSTLASYAADLGWQVLGYDPLLPESNINNSSFETVISQSDVVSLHVPLTVNKSVDPIDGSDFPTRHLIDAAALTKMPKDTMLINTARGAVVEEAALSLDIDQTGRQVVLDVFEHEPTIDSDFLVKLAIATPHIAGYSLEGKLRGTQMIYDALCERMGIEHKQAMQQLLPENCYLWSELKAHPDRLIKFYNISQDDALLRAVVRGGIVSGKDFDQLRRDYRLRREWQNDMSI